MTARKQPTPLADLPKPPGRDLLRAVTKLGWSQRELARRLGISPVYVCDVCAGRRGMSLRFALRLERIPELNRSAYHWAHLQLLHDLAAERLRP